LSPSDDDLALHAALLNYLVEEDKWVGRIVGQMSADLPFSLLPRLVQYARGGRVQIRADIESLAEAVFGGKRLDPRAWGDRAYEDALKRLRSWARCEDLEHRIKTALEQGAREYRNPALRIQSVRKQLTALAWISTDRS
jgi:hypothetical protein